MQLQRKAGNRAVQRLLPPTPTRAVQPDPAGLTLGGASIQRIWPFTSARSDKDLIEEAISKRVPDPISDIKDVNQATSEQKLQLIDVLLDHEGGNLNQQLKLAEIWDSYGAGLKSVADANIARWKRSFETCPSAMRGSREVKTLSAAFLVDTVDVANKYLNDNEQFTRKELQDLGLSETDDASTAPPTAAQTDAIQKRQAAAKDLADAQEARKRLLDVMVGYNVKYASQGGGELPQGGADGVTEQLVPMRYDPEHEPPAGPKPDDNFQPWKKVDDS